MSFFSNYQDLDALGVKHNTNKASSWKNAEGSIINMAGGMLTKYEFFFYRFKEKYDLSILELGAGPDFNIGASIRVWKEYFPGATVHVADNKDSATALREEGFHVHVGDLGKLDFVQRLAGQRWDVVIDDASHLWAHQILAFRKIFPSMVSGGIYVVEDLCTSYAHYRVDYSKGSDMRDAVNYFLAISRGVCFPQPIGNDEELGRIYTLTAEDEHLIRKIDLISWMGNSCVIIKK